MKRSFTQPYTWLLACGVVWILAGCNRPKTDVPVRPGPFAAGKPQSAAGGARRYRSQPSPEAKKLYDEGLAYSDQIGSTMPGEVPQAAAKDPNCAMPPPLVEPLPRTRRLGHVSSRGSFRKRVRRGAAGNSWP